ncbi:MAG: ABC transporter permease [Vicinamibacterales bacterium]
MNAFVTQLRHGARMLVRRPGLSLAAVVALALGIGLTTTMFSIVYLAEKGLPFERAERLVALFRNRPAQGVRFMGIGIQDFEDWRRQQTSFEDLAAYYAETVNVGGTEGRPVRYLGAYASARLFDLLRVRPVLGRTFRAAEDHPSSPPVMILSYRAWQDRFQGDPNIIGRTVRANAEVTTIVGVMPELFSFPSQMDAWLPLRIDPLAYSRSGGPALEGTQLQAIGRLKDGVTVEQAQAEMSAIAGRLAAEYPASNAGVGITLVPQGDLFVGPPAKAMLLTMLAAVFGVLLIACANVANLLLARTAVRSKEVAVRTALGASRWRTVGEVLGETLVLAAAGAVVGLVIARVGVDFFNAGLATQELPLWFVARLEPGVVAFVAGLTLLAALLAGGLPALRASRTNVVEILNDESRGSSGLRMGRISRALVVTQIALSCGLLVAAGLMIKTVVNITTFDYGFDASHIFTARLGLFEKDYPTPEAQRQFYDRLADRLQGTPGLRAAAFTSDLPGRGSSQRLPLTLDGVAYATDDDHPLARRIVITPGYFDVVGVSAIRGRTFTRQDGPDGQPVALVNERFVALFFPDSEPIGARLRLGGDREPWRVIVGVVPDLHAGGAVGALDPRDEGVYVPLAQNTINFMSLVARTEQDPGSYAATIQDAVNQVDPALPLYWVRGLSDQFALDTWFFRAFGTLFVAFGLAALVLATIGLYGIMAFSAANRTREIGVRMALGADTGSVLRLFLRQGAWQIGLGLGFGLVLAALLSRGLGILLFGVRPWDPAIFGGVVVTLVTTGLLASMIPARRAARIDPADALRDD